MTLSRALRIIVAVALTTYILFRSNPAEVARVAAGASLSWLLLAVVLVVVDRAVNAYRWVVLLQALTPDPHGRDAHLSSARSSAASCRALAVTSTGLSTRPARRPVGRRGVSPGPDRRRAVDGHGGGRHAALPAGVRASGVVAPCRDRTCAIAALVFSSGVAGWMVALVGSMAKAQPRLNAVDASAVRSHHGALVGVLALSVVVQLLRVVRATVSAGRLTSHCR